MIRIKRILQFVWIIAAGMVGVIISALICTNVLSLLGIIDSFFGRIILTWIAMLIGFCIIPTYILKKNYMITKINVGICSISRMEIVFCLSVFSITILYIINVRNISNITLLLVALLQNIGVAIFEEYFTKGILFCSLQKVTNKKIIILLVCSCVFAFVLHSSDNFITNLVYRFPLAIILGVCYLKTNKLYIPITLHLVNNLMVTSLLK